MTGAEQQPTGGASLVTLAVAMLPQRDEDLAPLLQCERSELAELRAAPDRAGTFARHLIANALRCGAPETEAPAIATALADALGEQASSRYERALTAALSAAAERGATPAELEAIVAASLEHEIGLALPTITEVRA